MKKSLALLTIAALAAGCSSARPKPTAAGSTAVLRLLRDWRGVWSGTARESPMGGMPYTLHVEESGKALKATMAHQKDADLDSMRHGYELVSFKSGTPLIRYSLAQRATQQEGEVVYREDLSSDDEAVFCPEDTGCDKLKLSIARISDKALELRTLVNEAAHSVIELRFVSRDIPKQEVEETDAAPPKKKPAEDQKAKDAPPKKKGAVDDDLYLKENPDKDIGESPDVDR